MSTHAEKVRQLFDQQENILSQSNSALTSDNGVYQRWQNPVVTRAHVPLTWRFDFNEDTNPQLLQRIGFNATFNAGAMKWKEKYVVVVRVEGDDRKSFFAIAESDNGVDNFRFWSRPIVLPQTNEPDTNVYDMRLTAHEDGYIYGLFCSERKDISRPEDLSAAVACCGIARTKDLVEWERLPDLISHSGQQRNVVLHPEFIDGKYGLYTRPQDGFIEVGSGGGIHFGVCDSMEHAELREENLLDEKIYHTIKESKNGQGPAPIKTEQGWLHLAHGVRNTAAGLRYVLYVFMTDLDKPWLVTHKPAGHFIAPLADERIGDVSNVVFSNGWIADENGAVKIYYASSDTRLHVATSSIDKLLDYCLNTPEDGLTSAKSVENIINLVDANEAALKNL